MAVSSLKQHNHVKKGALAVGLKEMLFNDPLLYATGTAAMLMTTVSVNLFPSLFFGLTSPPSSVASGMIARVRSPSGPESSIPLDRIVAFVSRTTGQSNKTSFWFTAAGIIIIGASCSFLRTRCFKLIKERANKRLKQRVFASLLAQDKAFFDQLATDPEGGDQNLQRKAANTLMNNVSEDIEVVATMGSETAIDSLRFMSSIFNGTYMLLKLSPKLFAGTLCLVPVFAVVIGRFSKYKARIEMKHTESADQAAAYAQERLSNLTTVHLSNMEQFEIFRYNNLLTTSLSYARQVANAQGTFMGGLFFVGGGALCSLLYFSNYLVSRGDIPQAHLNTFFTHAALLTLATSGLAQNYASWIRASISATKVDNLVCGLPLRSQKVGPSFRGVPVQIRFENVTFSYPTRISRPVLFHFTLNVVPGQVLALSGPSGCGKSTVVNLLTRMYEPSEGTIFLNDINIAEYDETWLRSQIAVVEQEPVLFTGTIFDNIHYGCPGASGDEIMEAARQANAHDFIMAFPQGYHTPIGPRDSTQLSGGQKQRLALARAFLKNAPILALDEATSALDVDAETQVLSAMKRLFAGRTILIISHRESTLETADFVATMSNGSVAECLGKAERSLRVSSA